MVCIYCGSDTAVTNTRPQKRLNNIWRRRHCKACGAIFTSIEAADLAYSVSYKKPTGDLEPFSRDKLLLSIHESCKHRSDAAEAASALTDTIIQQVLPTINDGLVARGDIVVIAKKTLAHFDKTAATHYTAFHPIR
jgi:transcriptional repressor NrdR